jgi:hypothetical protein
VTGPVGFAERDLAKVCAGVRADGEYAVAFSMIRR